MDNYCCDIQYTVQYMFLQLYFQYGDCQSPAGAGAFLPTPSPGFFRSFYYLRQAPGTYISRHGKRPAPQNATVFHSGDS